MPGVRREAAAADGAVTGALHDVLADDLQVHPVVGRGVRSRRGPADVGGGETAGARDEGAAEQHVHHLDVVEQDLAGQVVALDDVRVGDGESDASAAVLGLEHGAFLDLRGRRHGDETDGHEPLIGATHRRAVRVEPRRPQHADVALADADVHWESHLVVLSRMDLSAAIFVSAAADCLRIAIATARSSGHPPGAPTSRRCTPVPGGRGSRSGRRRTGASGSPPCAGHRPNASDGDGSGRRLRDSPGARSHSTPRSAAAPPS